MASDKQKRANQMKSKDMSVEINGLGGFNVNSTTPCGTKSLLSRPFTVLLGTRLIALEEC